MPRATQSLVETPSKRPTRGSVSTRPKDLEAVRNRGINTSSKAGAALVSVDKPLTEMQKRFVKIWATGETILSASYRAGYADGGTFAYRMVRQPNILALYQEEKRLYEEAAQMSRKKVMDMLLEAYEHAKLAGEPASMVSAAREVGKMCGYYEPVRHVVDVNVQGTVMLDRLNRLSDAELLKAITEGEGLALIEGEPADANA